VLASLFQRLWTLGSEHSLEVWVLVQVSLSLVVSESPSTSTKSTLRDTNSSVVGLWIEHGVNVIITGGIAFSIIIIQGFLGRRRSNLGPRGCSLTLHLLHLGVDSRSFNILLLFLIIIFHRIDGRCNLKLSQIVESLLFVLCKRYIALTNSINATEE
jgi:hypothetical protein